MTVRKTLFALTATAPLLAACGGNDSGPPPDYAVSAAIDNLLTSGGSWTMTGTGADGLPFTLTMTFAPAAPGVFPVSGATASSTPETITLVSGGVSSSATQSIYRDPSTSAILGLEADGECSVSTSQPALPDKAKAPSNGAIVDVSDLDGCALSSLPVGTTAFTWSVETDKGVTLLCWNLMSRDLSGIENGTESNCTEIAADGTLGKKARFSVASGPVVASARNF